MKPIASIRSDYTKASLEITSIDKDPVIQFEKWFNEAIQSEVLEPNAMTLSTITESGRPSARIVLLKGIEQSKFLFYTNYQSRKGKELEKNAACALTFFWPELERQIRIEGMSERLAENTSLQYFQSRPRGSQIGAWASPQSSVIKNREILEGRVKEIEKRFEGMTTLPKPHQWGGYAVAPFEIEFWQGRSNRLHDRIVYTLSKEGWNRNRLAP
ncbi:MAG: pyridoxamine 5'-phosphate oxidase [Cyclobacteriaceae bacterium]|nr:pyridoxamine 5'-phosphate oxidase [Cyclobacteriaceae bacterium]